MPSYNRRWRAVPWGSLATRCTQEGNPIVQVASLFNQLLQHFPRTEFAALVKKHAAERAAIQAAGAVLCVLGLVVAIWARSALGSNWSGSPATKAGHELVTSGPYRLVRHPGYLAAIIGGTLAVKTYLQKGPTITIAFKTGEGLEAGKTKIKYKDVEAMEDGSILLCLFNGGIRNSENEEIAHLLRRKSKILVAFGSCATEGCIPGLANLSTVEQLLEASYEGVTTDNPEHLVPLASWAAPEGELRLPLLEPTLRPLDRVVAVDIVDEYVRRIRARLGRHPGFHAVRASPRRGPPRPRPP